MYGGLFGDLPSTKKSMSTLDGTPNAETSKDDTSKPKNKKPPSVVSGLGTAGTTMAFVPAALRQRKRPAAAMSSSASKVAAVPPPGVIAKATEPKQDALEKTSPVTATVDAPVSEVSIHKQSNDRTSSPLLVLEEESDEFRALHASVKDVYDPFVPNDLQAYWERKAHEQQRLELERSARETLERQQKLRQQLEQERQAIEATGNVQQIVQHRTERSIAGRGRGLSNLPAWLVQKQKEEADGPVGIPSEKQKQVHEQDAHGCTVELCNLTAPGEVDNDLAQEVQEECEETCGKVVSVRVEDAAPLVRVFVTFAQGDHAQQAAKLFHGRMFGQRRITAKLADETNS